MKKTGSEGFVRWMAAALLAAAVWGESAAEPAAPRNLRFGGSGGPVGSAPHPLYPALDMATLPLYGTPEFTYEAPALPNATRDVTIGSAGSQAARDLLAACQQGGARVRVPGTAGNVGPVNLGFVDDCDITLEEGVVIGSLQIGGLPGGVLAPVRRLRIRGGRIGSLSVTRQSMDLIFDGVILQQGGINFSGSTTPGDNVERFAMINSIIRCLPITLRPADLGTAGSGYLGGYGRNVLFANNNIVTAGNNNSWGFRISGGANVFLIDNIVRVSHHKLVRFDGTVPTEYVVIRGGLWMRENTLGASGTFFSDSFSEVTGAGDNVYIHDTAVYIEPSSPPDFGASMSFPSIARRWEVRRLQWHVLNANVMSDSHLNDYENRCTGVVSCDFGLGTHGYVYANPPGDPDGDLSDDPVVFPANPWRPLPAIADPNPDNVPTAGLAYCGNGAVEGNEECDDGGNANGDGCAGGCQRE